MVVDDAVASAGLETDLRARSTAINRVSTGVSGTRRPIAD
jgi:hypothetical protein